MQIFRKPILVAMLPAVITLFSCSGRSAKTLPPPPGQAADVQRQLKGKSLHTTATGYYGSLVINDKPEAEWIDTTVVKESLIRNVIRETNSFALNFKSDTAVTITRGAEKFEGTWKVNNETDEDEAHGVYLRLSFADPEFNLPMGEVQKVTYTYMVKGVDDKSLLLELPREINRRKLVSLMEQ